MTVERAWLEDKETWLFDLAHDNLDEDTIVKGFLKHYVLLGYGIGNVLEDMLFYAHDRDFYLEAAMSNLRRALENQIEAPPRSEMRTLDEVQCIVDTIRAGIQVQVAYDDPETDDDSYISHTTW